MPKPAPEIKETIRDLIHRCPLGSHQGNCPFALLGLLGHASRESVLRGLSDDECVRLFELTGHCQCPADPRPASAEPAPVQVHPPLSDPGQ